MLKLQSYFRDEYFYNHKFFNSNWYSYNIFNMKIKIYNFFLIIKDIIVLYLICFYYYYYYFNKDNKGHLPVLTCTTPKPKHMDRINFYGFEFIDQIYY